MSTPAQTPTAAIVVTRAFWLQGQVRAVGDRLEVPEPLAAELIGVNKAVRAPAESAPVGVESAEAQPEAKPARRSRATKDTPA